MSTKEKAKIDFEKGMSRLDEIITEFDEGGLSLDDMEKYFVEGMELIQQCSERLDHFEAKVSKLMEKFDLQPEVDLEDDQFDDDELP